MSTRFSIVATAGLVLAAMSASSAPTSVPTDVTLVSYIAAISAHLDPRVAQTLGGINSTGRQLLALRSYVQSAAHLDERWSWSRQEIQAFEGSPQQRDLQQEIDRVGAAFAAANPGYELHVNPQVRSLEDQIDKWNRNPSVLAASAQIVLAAKAFVVTAGHAADPMESRRLAFERFLSSFTPATRPSIAAPGLSLHGQMRAADFQVYQRGRVVAGPSTASITKDWEASGWSAKLDAAVRTASSRFVGPQKLPPEPWHYNYVPKEAGTQ